MPTVQDAYIRHGSYYVSVLVEAENQYLNGGDEAQKGLALFDSERPQIEMIWQVTSRLGSTPERDELIVNYAASSVNIAMLRATTRDEQIVRYQQVLEAARRINDKQAEGAALGLLGITYYTLGDMAQAISYHEQGLRIARASGDRFNEGAALNTLAAAHNGLGTFAQAIEYFEQALLIARELHEPRNEAMVLGNLGITYKNMGDFQRALDLYRQQLEVVRKIGDRHGEGISLTNLGVVYLSLNELDRSADSYEQALAIAHALGDRRFEAIISWNLGEVYERRGDLEGAIVLMQVDVEVKRTMGHADAERLARYVDELRQRAALGSNSNGDVQL